MCACVLLITCVYMTAMCNWLSFVMSDICVHTMPCSCASVQYMQFREIGTCMSMRLLGQHYAYSFVGLFRLIAQQ